MTNFSFYISFTFKSLTDKNRYLRGIIKALNVMGLFNLQLVKKSHMYNTIGSIDFEKWLPHNWVFQSTHDHTRQFYSVRFSAYECVMCHGQTWLKKKPKNSIKMPMLTSYLTPTWLLPLLLNVLIHLKLTKNAITFRGHSWTTLT